MGQVNYKTDYTAFPASQHRVEEGSYAGDAYAGDQVYSGKCLRPRARITRALAGALLISIVTHGIFTIAVALAPTAPATSSAQQTSYISTTRVVHLDWEQYHAQHDSAAAPEPPKQPEVAAAVADEPTHRDEPKKVQRPEVPSEPDATSEVENAVATAPVEAIVDTGDDTKIQLPDANDGSENALPNDNSARNTRASGGVDSGANKGHAGIARGPHRRADSSGDGSSVDLGEVRRGHLSQLNRAIRKQNPCTRKLAHRGLSGDVVLGLTQHSDGRVDEVRVLRSSGEALIDDAAKKFVQNQQRLPAPSQSLKGDVWKIGLRFKCGT